MIICSTKLGYINEVRKQDFTKCYEVGKWPKKRTQSALKDPLFKRRLGSVGSSESLGLLSTSINRFETNWVGISFQLTWAEKDRL